MARREYILVMRCQHPGCTETNRYLFHSKKAYNEGYARYRDSYWCTRHRPGSVNIMPDTPDTVRVQEFTCQEIETPSIFGGPPFKTISWGEGGLKTGDGWSAYAKDFPPGAKIIIETHIRVVLPDDE